MKGFWPRNLSMVLRVELVFGPRWAKVRPGFYFVGSLVQLFVAKLPRLESSRVAGGGGFWCSWGTWDPLVVLVVETAVCFLSWGGVAGLIYAVEIHSWCWLQR